MLSVPPPSLLAGASLFLDFDGTLVEIAERPDLIRVDNALLKLLDDLAARSEGRVALISGRAAGDLLTRIAGRPIVVAGSHGCEFVWPDGRREAPAHSDAVVELVAAADSFARAHTGVLVEEKPFGVAIHYRQAPQHEAACNAFANRLLALGGLALQPGRMVIELKPSGANKGIAVRRLMRDTPFSQGRPIFIGDDRTDEAGFSAARALGGCGVLVGSPRETAAEYVLPDVPTVRRWLAADIGARA